MVNQLISWRYLARGFNAIGLATFLALSFAQSVSAATYTVTKFTDLSNAPCASTGSSTYDCDSLRAAVSAANANVNVVPDTITLGTGTYVLAIASTNEDANKDGDLDITDPLIINGNGAGSALIDGKHVDQVFDIRPSAKIVTISSVTITNGTGNIRNDATLRLNDSVVSYSYNAAAIFNTGTAILTGSDVSNNGLVVAASPGGIYNYGTLTLDRSTVRGNKAGSMGGIRNSLGASLTLTDSTVSGNTASGAVGGILNDCGSLTLVNSTVSGNKAGTDGGGIYNRRGNCKAAGILALINSTISGNSAGGAGGGIMNGCVVFNPTCPSDLPKIILSNSTIARNAAGTAGAGILNVVGTVSAKNTIVAENKSGGSNSNCSGAPISSLGHNLADDATCFSGGTDLQKPSGLGSLANHGGLTETIDLLLLPQSLAIDAVPYPADCVFAPGLPQTGLVPKDQRGVNRPDGTDCDIGAYETKGAPTGSLTVVKKVVPDIAGVEATTMFTIDVTCTPPAGPAVKYSTSIWGKGSSMGPSSQTFSGVPAGSVCHVTKEWPPARNGGAPSTTFIHNGKTCTWNAPTDSQTPSTIGSGTNRLTVINSYTCGPGGPGSLQIIKKAVNPPVPVGGAHAYMDINCTSPTLSMPHQAVPYGPIGLTIPGIAANSSCTVFEPPGVMQNMQVCGGGTLTVTPSYSSPMPVTIPAGGKATVTVTNTFTCGPASKSYLKVEKIVVDPTGSAPAGYKFPISLQCSNFKGAWLPVPLAGGTCSSNDPSASCGTPTAGGPSQPGLSCMVREGPLPLVQSQACGGYAAWSKSIAPSSVAIPASGTALLSVTNTLRCVQIQEATMTVLPFPAASPCANTSIPIAAATDCPSAITAAQAQFKAIVSAGCLSYHCAAGETAEMVPAACVQGSYMRPDGKPGTQWNVFVRWACH